MLQSLVTLERLESFPTVPLHYSKTLIDYQQSKLNSINDFIVSSCYNILTLSGGVLTPGFTFCNSRLIERLQNCGFDFKVIRNDSPILQDRKLANEGLVYS